MLSVVNAEGSTESGSLIDEIVREGARRMLAAALEAEVNQQVAELAAERDEHGHRLVVRNGHHRPRTVVTAAGPVEVTVPRVNDRRVGEATGERKRFSSKILAPWCRKSPKVSEVLPLLYLHGLSSEDFVPALEQFLGSADQAVERGPRRLPGARPRGPRLRLRVGRRRAPEGPARAGPLLCAGAARGAAGWHQGVDRDRGGPAEYTESWADLLRGCRQRGMRDPELVVGDGAMGLWKALAVVFPAARHQRCWVHKARNALPKSAQPGATKAMQDIYNAEDRAQAEKAIEVFTKTYGAKWPKAVAEITDDREELLAFYDFPAEHWVHLRATNPIESTFSTVKLRTKVTRGAGSPAAALTMVFKLVESA